MSAYAIEEKEKTSSMSENKEKACDGYIRMYEYRKHLLYSMYEHTGTSQERIIIKMKEIVEI